MKTLSLAVEPGGGDRMQGGPGWVSGRVLDTEQLGSTDTTAQAGYYPITLIADNSDSQFLNKTEERRNTDVTTIRFLLLLLRM